MTKTHNLSFIVDLYNTNHGRDLKYDIRFDPDKKITCNK